jgi:ABC-type glycerol-3-phosphate transport system substrate-binding protein
MKNKRFLALCLFVVLAGILCFNSSYGNAKTVVTVLRPGDLFKVKQWAEPCMNEFNKKHSNIEIKMEYMSWGDWITKYPTLMNTNTQPDVIFWWDNQLADKAIVKKLVPLTNYMDKSVLKLYPKKILDIGTVKGKLVYLPQALDPMVIFYRKDIFQQAGLEPENPPETWAEFLNACKTIYTKTGIPALGFQGKLGMNTLQEFIAFFYHQGSGRAWLNTKNKPLFNSPKAVEALTYIKQLQQYAQPGMEQYARGDLRALFANGKIAMTMDSDWFIPDLQAKFGKELDGIGIMSPPAGPAGKVEWVSTNGWVVTNKNNAKAAGKVVSFLASKEQLYKHHIAYGNASLLDYEKTQPTYKYGFWNSFSVSLNDYKLFTPIGQNSSTPKAFYVRLEEVWQQFLLDKLSAKEALKLAEQKVLEINAQAGR